MIQILVPMSKTETDGPDIWTRIRSHQRRWRKANATMEELQLQRRDLITEAADQAPVSLIAEVLGVTTEAIYRILRENKAA